MPEEFIGVDIPVNIVVDKKSKNLIHMLEPILNFLSELKNPSAYLFAGISVMVFAPDELFFVGPLLISIFLGSLATYLYQKIAAWFMSQCDEWNKKTAIKIRDRQILSDYDSLDDTERDEFDKAILTGTEKTTNLSPYQMTNLNRKGFGRRVSGISTDDYDYFKFCGEYFEAVARMKHPELHDKIKKNMG